MNKEILRIKPKSIELSESNDIFMTLTLCILTNQVNLNNARFTDEYIAGVVANKDTYIGIPLQVNRTKLENGSYSSLTHELDKKTGLLKTDTIGSFVDFWEQEDEDGSKLLMGTAKVPKRYPAVCQALIDLFDTGELEFSCETIVYGYESVQDKVRNIAYEYEGQVNGLMASCVVSYPAEIKSKAFTLVAEAIEKDLEGGEQLSQTPQSQTEVFNKGNEIRIHGDFELSSLKYTEINQQIYNLLNPINPKSENRQYNFWISDLYTDYVIVEEWYDYETLWKIPYTINNDVVILAADSDWVKGKKGFIPDGVVIDTLQSELASIKQQLQEKEQELQEVNQKVKTAEELQEELTKLEKANKDLSDKVTELNGLVVSQEEKIKTFETNATELNAQIEQLRPFKDQVETAEKQAKQDALKEKFAKVLSEEIMKSEEVTKAIEELNEVKLSEVVVSEILKQKASAPQTPAPAANADVVVNASRQEDLLPTDRKSYWASPKSE